MDINAFRKKVYDYYEKHGRDLPWRKTTDPYAILVSEVMLQQTQVDRVIPKYKGWMDRFPDLIGLANASLQSVMQLWAGLGYNRRAKMLRDAAKKVVDDHDGQVPADYEKLISLPGIGDYTANALLAFAFNQPVVVIETNIRSVYIHTFFPNEGSIDDAQLVPLIEETMDCDDPRRWYNALMDYGEMIKNTFGNPNKNSKQYAKQSKFEGSDRQIRGSVIRLLTREGSLSVDEMNKGIGCDRDRLTSVLRKLSEEHLILRADTTYRLAN